MNRVKHSNIISGEKTATCKVTVNIPLKSIYLNKTSIELNAIGDSYQLNKRPRKNGEINLCYIEEIEKEKDIFYSDSSL